MLTLPPGCSFSLDIYPFQVLLIKLVLLLTYVLFENLKTKNTQQNLAKSHEWIIGWTVFVSLPSASSKIHTYVRVRISLQIFTLHLLWLWIYTFCKNFVKRADCYQSNSTLNVFYFRCLRPAVYRNPYTLICITRSKVCFWLYVWK